MSALTQTLVLPDPDATDALGAALAAGLGPQPLGLIALEGGLGAGKTHLVRSLLRALGVAGPVKSPTYTLVEPYDLPGGGRVLHLDLYRLAAVEDWWGLGLEDEPPDQSLWCVEWPSMAGDALPAARLTISLEAAAGGRVARLRWQDAGDGAVKIVTTHMKIVV